MCGILRKKRLFLRFLIQVFKVRFLLWLDEIEKFVNEGKSEVYAETVFDEIFNKILLCPLYFIEEYCLEIDTEKDLEAANAHHVLSAF